MKRLDRHELKRKLEAEERIASSIVHQLRRMVPKPLQIDKILEKAIELYCIDCNIQNLKKKERGINE